MPCAKNWLIGNLSLLTYFSLNLDYVAAGVMHSLAPEIAVNQIVTPYFVL